MPLLYESVYLQRRRFSPAGRASIVAPPTAYDVKTGEKITVAYAGQVFHISVSVYNYGTSDTIWCTAKDKDTGQIIVNQKGERMDFEQVLGTGVGWGPSFYWIAMPSKALPILIEAGHGSGAARVKDTEASLYLSLTGVTPPTAEVPLYVWAGAAIAGGVGLALLIRALRK